MTKTIEQLEQEAKEARDSAVDALDLNNPNRALFVNRMLEAAVAMVTYQFALASQEEKQDKISIKLKNPYNTSTQLCNLEVQDDGWIEWNGGECPVDGHTKVQVKFNTDTFGNPCKNPYNGIAENFHWYHDMKYGIIIAYRIAKQE